VALAVLSAGFLTLVFTTPRTWFLMALYSVLYAVAIGGLNQNSFNIAYSYVDSNYITEALAIKNCLGGVCGFLASLAGGAILRYVQRNGNTLFGIHVYGQQVLAAISFLLVLVALAVMVKVIGKQKVMKQ
jgi:hypothetical protein